MASEATFERTARGARTAHPTGGYYRVPRRLVHLGCFGVFVLLFALVVGLGFWLRALSYFLVVDQPLPPRADAIVVLGGGGTHGARETQAARLYRSGIATVVVTTGGPVAGEREATYAQWSIDRLVRRGVPREAVVPTFAGDSTSTDALGVRAMAEARGWTTLVVVTDDWHSRRAQLVFARVFNGSPIRYYLSPADGPRFDPEAWWLDETSALIVVSEYVKLLAYVVGG
ncbi:MAG TPA: YdcF family protein [Chloroflexota bacterium]|nr:YdcF family protein [Chloroflexota bacterium]